MEEHKRLQINASKKLPEDRAVPRGEDAAAGKGYINVLKPSPAQRNNPSSFPSFPSMLLQGDFKRLGRGKTRGVFEITCLNNTGHPGIAPTVVWGRPWQHPSSHHPNGGQHQSAPSTRTKVSKNQNCTFYLTKLLTAFVCKGGGLSLSVTHVINYFLTISSFPAS